MKRIYAPNVVSIVDGKAEKMTTATSDDLEKLNEKIYNKITTYAKDLVSTGCDIENQFGIPIVNKRISVTPISLVGSSCCKSVGDYVKIAKALDVKLSDLVKSN